MFKDNELRIRQRSLLSEQEKIHEKLPFFIKPLDELVYGGIDKGETALFVARSGAGKSTFLRHVGYNNGLYGNKVLHIQLEGGKEETLQKYDQLLSRESFTNVKMSKYDIETRKKLKKLITQMLAHGREIHVFASEQFGEYTIQNVRQLIIEYHKLNGYFPDLLIVDYIELLGDSTNRYGISTEAIKMKLTNVARYMKNLTNEFYPMRVLTATQTSDVHFTKWNDPQFYITRNEIRGDKNLIDSFSYVVTWNQTKDEKKSGIGRLYTDKIRHYKSESSVKIKTGFEKGLFYVRNSNVEQESKDVLKMAEARKKIKTRRKMNETKSN